jgi:hypothetical protein
LFRNRQHRSMIQIKVLQLVGTVKSMNIEHSCFFTIAGVFNLYSINKNLFTGSFSNTLTFMTHSYITRKVKASFIPSPDTALSNC